MFEVSIRTDVLELLHFNLCKNANIFYKLSEVYSEPCQTSKMEPIIYPSQGFKYAPELLKLAN